MRFQVQHCLDVVLRWVTDDHGVLDAAWPHHGWGSSKQRRHPQPRVYSQPSCPARGAASEDARSPRCVRSRAPLSSPSARGRGLGSPSAPWDGYRRCYPTNTILVEVNVLKDRAPHRGGHRGCSLLNRSDLHRDQRHLRVACPLGRRLMWRRSPLFRSPRETAPSSPRTVLTVTAIDPSSFGSKMLVLSCDPSRRVPAGVCCDASSRA